MLYDRKMTRKRKPKGRRQQREPLHPSGLGRRPGAAYACGLCGITGHLTKTHIPPQAAGNHDRALRYHFITQGQSNHSIKSRSLPGGMQSDMLCNGCNSLQSKYDATYATLAKSLLPWRPESNLQLRRVDPPHIKFQPGAVVRSVLIGMFGLNPHLRTRHPEVASALISESPIPEMPPNARLYLALARGHKARVTGYWQLHTILDYQALAVEILAQVYFPPLAWILADESKSLLDFEGWIDVSPWLALQPATADYLDNQIGPIPIVYLPDDNPLRTGHVGYMSIEGWTENLECDDVRPGLALLQA
jgi:hypothetical protein